METFTATRSNYSIHTQIKLRTSLNSFAIFLSWVPRSYQIKELSRRAFVLGDGNDCLFAIYWHYDLPLKKKYVKMYR